MTLEMALVNKLLATSAVTALAGTRIHPGEAPEGDADPHVVFFNSSIITHHTMGQDSNKRHEFWQINAFSRDYDTARAVAEAIRATLVDFSGVMGGAGGVTVDRVFLQDAATETLNGVVNSWLEFEIWYEG